MTEKEVAEGICNAYLEAEDIWSFSDYNKKVTSIIFYLRALRDVEATPHKAVYVQTKIVKFINDRLDDEFRTLPNESIEDLFDLSSRVP